MTADVKYTNFTLLEYDKREDIKWRTDQLDDVHVVCRCYISKPYSPLYKNGVYLMDTVTKVEFAKSLLNQNT